MIKKVSWMQNFNHAVMRCLLSFIYLFQRNANDKYKIRFTIYLSINGNFFIIYFFHIFNLTFFVIKDPFAFNPSFIQLFHDSFKIDDDIPIDVL